MENALAIRSIGDVQKTAEIMVASGFFKDARDVAKACVKILAGQELGIDPVAAMRGIDIVEGQISIRAHLMGGMIKRSGKYDYAIARQDDQVCEIEFLQEGKPLGTSTFTMEDAKRAGLANKGPWKAYPGAMLYNRAMSQGARMYCPDIFLGGVYYEGEIEEAKAIERNVTPKDVAPPEKQRKGLVAGWNAETQTMDVYQPVGDGSVPTEEEHEETLQAAADERQEYEEAQYGEDDIPDPMTEPQRMKLLGMLKQLGVHDGDKRELLGLLNLDKYGASALIEKIMKDGADKFPWQVLSVYIGLLKNRTGKTNEDIADYCSSTWNERHPASLDRQGRTAMFEWLAGFTESAEEEEVIDELAEWIEGANVSSESLSKMTEEEIQRAMTNWKARQERINA